MLTITVKVGKQGGSIRMTIPDPIAEELNIKNGDFVEVGVKGYQMIVTKKSVGE